MGKFLLHNTHILNPSEFSHAFIQQMFTEHLLCTLYFKHLKYNGEHDRQGLGILWHICFSGETT